MEARIEPLSGSLPHVGWRWDPETDILSGSFKGTRTQTGLTGTVELADDVGSVTVLDPQVSTKGEMGQVVLTVLGMVAQMERRLIKERQREGIERAKADGTYKGGKRRLDRKRIRSMREAGLGVTQIASELGCSRMQVYRVLAE